MDLRALSTSFEHANLALQIESLPLDRGRRVDSAEIVQLDIARDRYRLFPGNTRTNRVDVAGTDRHRRQLVLVVDEPRRPLPARVRHFLCGMDESHLFIAQLPRVANTVDDAHDALRPEFPSEYRRGIVRRQGEWFFLPVTLAERCEINTLAPRSIGRRIGIAEAARVLRRGRQHVATEVCLLEPGARIYARGEVRHPEHASLALRGWHRVLPNLEPFERVPPRRARGIRWFD